MTEVSDTPTLMHVTDLACQRGSLPVLSGVSFALNPGDCLILRGPNGIGKSTLLRTLAGLCSPSAGTLSVDPEHCTYAGHLDAIKSPLSVTENLNFWAQIYGRAPQTVTKALDAFSLTSLADRPAAQLSAGQKRRLGLARLPVTGRKIWLLDEPTTALDSAHVETFELLVRAHLQNGGVAVISTHQPLNIPKARTLDLAQFAATASAPFADPFLETFT